MMNTLRKEDVVVEILYDFVRNTHAQMGEGIGRDCFIFFKIWTNNTLLIII